MTVQSHADLASERRFSLIIGALAGTSFISFAVVLDSVFDAPGVQFGLIGLLMLGVAVFAYKSELKRQQDEIERERTSNYLGVFTLKKSPANSATALTRGLQTALRALYRSAP